MGEDRYRDAERRLWGSVGASPVEQHVTLPRVGTRVRIQVVGEGPPLVFVHGASTNGTIFASLAAHLTGFRCVLLDRPGCGLSDALGGTLTLERLPRFAEVRDTDTMRNEIRQGPPIITPLRGYDEDVTLTEEMRASVRAPTCLLWGEDDLFGGPETARRFAADLPHAELEVLPGAGHAPWLDQPEHVATRIAGFLDS